MASFRLTQRQSNIFLAVSVVTLAAVAGTAIGVMVPKLLAKSPPPSLVGFVMNAPVLAPNFTLRDQRGAMISLSSLRSNVIALTFLDTQCVQICPLQASLLGRVQSDLGSRAPFSVVVVSIHPEADTPSNIANFASAHGLRDPFYWLTGTRAQLADVWNSYGVGVQVVTGDVVHTSVIYLIDRKGYERVAFPDAPEAAGVESDVRILAST
ncbi:MAG TPA: SCO family protein [Chloroflexota bacterium]